MPRGGARPNAGRKTNVEIGAWRTLHDSAVSAARRKKIISNVARIAEKGDNERAVVEAAKLLWAYRYGLPTQPIGGDDAAAPIRIVEYRGNETADRDTKRTPDRKPASRSAKSA